MHEWLGFRTPDAWSESSNKKRYLERSKKIVVLHLVCFSVCHAWGSILWFRICTPVICMIHQRWRERKYEKDIDYGGRKRSGKIQMSLRMRLRNYYHSVSSNGSLCDHVIYHWLLGMCFCESDTYIMNEMNKIVRFLLFIYYKNIVLLDEQYPVASNLKVEIKFQLSHIRLFEGSDFMSKRPSSFLAVYPTYLLIFLLIGGCENDTTVQWLWKEERKKYKWV